jgi:alpha-2-macroglobulin
MFVGQGDRADARKLLQEILNHAKETPSEVHFEEADSLTYATLWSSDTRTSGIVLATLADVAPDHPFVSKIAAYLGKVRKGDGRFRNTQEASFALMALAEVARTKEKEVPSFTARVTLGEKTLAEEPFEGRSTEVKLTKVAMKDLPTAKEPLPFDFRRDGKAGVLYYGALMRYAPAEVPREPLERGLFVQRWVEPYAGGGQVRAARAGELVRFRVRIGTAQERHYVAISVPVPAGLEIVDTTLATTARAAAEPEEEGNGEGYELESEEDLTAGGTFRLQGNAWAFGFWSPFNFEERRDDRLVLFADRLPPGLHVASFVARATTPGEFVLTPAHAEEMYTPEVFGRSDGGTFKVIANEEVAGR